MNAINRLKDQLNLYWLARTEQERKYLTVGAAVVFGALIYMLFIDPAVTGRAKLRKELPELRQQAAQLQALALEAADIASQGVPQVTPMTREGLMASLAARGLKTDSLVMTGEFAKVNFTGVSFANLYAWTESQRREHRIGVLEAGVTASTPAGQVDATLTLRQIASPDGQ